MPSSTLILQSLASGVFIGALYGLIGLGLGLGWGLLRLINLAHFAWVFLSAYITFELKSRLGVDPLISLLVLMPLFGLLGVGMQAVLARFAITPFNSLLATFGLTVAVEAFLQLIWSWSLTNCKSFYYCSYMINHLCFFNSIFWRKSLFKNNCASKNDGWLYIRQSIFYCSCTANLIVSTSICCRATNHENTHKGNCN